MTAFGTLQHPRHWKFFGEAQSQYFLATFDIVSAKAFAYKNSYVLCLTLRTHRRVFFRTVEQHTMVFTPMDPLFLEAIFAGFRQAGREEDLVELRRQLKRNLKEVPTVTYLLCLSHVRFGPSM